MDDASQSQSKSHDIELGFKCLTLCCSKKDQKMHQNSCIMASNLMSPPPSPAFSHIGDYIGMESCLDMNSCEDVHVMSVTKATSYDHVRISSSSRKKKKTTARMREFPPPISLLARTENLSSHMAFVLKRYYTNDGRLILREEPVRRHEYFRAHRSNGHLTLQLVPLDDDDACDDENEHEHAQELEAEAEANVEEDEEMKIEGFVTQIPKSCINNNEGIDIGCGGGGGGGGEMCLNYSNVIISSSCYLGVPPVPAIKPVHT